MVRTTHARQGFTLVELLVSLAVLTALAATALLVVPDVLDQDRTTDGASLTRQWLMTAKGRATRDGLPRGVRLIVSPDANNPSKTNPLWVTELQYIESPPVLVGTLTPNASVSNATPPPAQPTIRFTYDAPGGVLSSPPPGPPFTGLHCYLTNAGIAAGQIQMDISSGRRTTLFLPVMMDTLATGDVGFWCHITNYNSGSGELSLDRYPSLGAATEIVTNHFGIFGAPQPLIGEPTQQLPKNICIDLASSSPLGTVGYDYDILFGPNGQVAPTYGTVGNVGQINLWVRDYTKPGGNGGDFNLGGEQQIVAMKTKSGSLGVFPVAWSGNPFQLAQQGATGYGN